MTNHTNISSSVAETRCSATGLPIHSRPEWTDRRFGSAYRLTSRVIGNRVLLNQPSGFADLAGIVDSLSDIGTLWQCNARFEPAMDAARRDQLLEGWKDAVRRVRSES